MKTREIYTHVSNKSHLDRLFENRGDGRFIQRDVYVQYCGYNTKMERYTHCKYNTKWEWEKLKCRVPKYTKNAIIRGKQNERSSFYQLCY